jgi:hypothetical protein
MVLLMVLPMLTTAENTPVNVPFNVIVRADSLDLIIFDNMPKRSTKTRRYHKIH